MKIKILKYSQPDGDYDFLVGGDVEVEWRDPSLTTPFTLMDYNWFWKRDELHTVAYEDATITDASGSPFEDGKRLGMCIGREKYRKELVGEGILDPEDEDEFDEDDVIVED